MLNTVYSANCSSCEACSSDRGRSVRVGARSAFTAMAQHESDRSQLGMIANALSALFDSPNCQLPESPAPLLWPCGKSPTRACGVSVERRAEATKEIHEGRITRVAAREALSESLLQL